MPVQPEIRVCQADNFLFLSGASQSDYDQYYASVANDTCHQELALGLIRSPISQFQATHLTNAVGDMPRKVLDFGCGAATLLFELATSFPTSAFFGFDPGPAAQTASTNSKLLGLSNLSIIDLPVARDSGPYDLVLLSHVMEHLIDLDLLTFLHDLVSENGLLYVEVPNPLAYDTHERLEFLYYFDRLHVNHFTPQSLSLLGSHYGFGHILNYEYAFPYRDGRSGYPAMGMLFQKGGKSVELESPSILHAAHRYIQQEHTRASELAGGLDTFDGVLVWGAGDNFYRSAGNGGPLSNLRNMVLLDRRPQNVTIGSRTYRTIDPLEGIRRSPWPVVVTVSERRAEITSQITEIDPARQILLV